MIEVVSFEFCSLMHLFYESDNFRWDFNLLGTQGLMMSNMKAVTPPFCVKG